jgi:hypothetical protein
MSRGDGHPFHWDLLVPRLVHPLKIEIVEAIGWIGQPLSATDLMKILRPRCSISGASYHLNTLAGVGVVEVVDERKVRGGQEKFYFFAPQVQEPPRRAAA